MTKREALSLLDITPRYEVVDINDEQSLRVRGLSAEEITELMVRFPELRIMALGGELNTKSMMSFGPKVVSALCAAATGGLGNEKAESIAADLPVETQLDILEAMGRCTFSKGFGPFVKRVVGIAQALSVQVGKVQDMSLPPQSKPLEEPPIQQSGD